MDEVSSGSISGCRWCQFVLRVVGNSMWEELDDTVTLKLRVHVNDTNVRNTWYHSLHISSSEYYLYTVEGKPDCQVLLVKATAN